MKERLKALNLLEIYKFRLLDRKRIFESRIPANLEQPSLVGIETGTYILIEG